MNIDLKFYWWVFMRRLPVMMALFLICSITATITALNLAPTYTTAARLLVEEPRIPDSMVVSMVDTDAGVQLQVIEQRLLTRANLLEIARKFYVFEDIHTMTPDEIIATMRKQTLVTRSGGRNQATLMRVSFEARSGQIAANVVNEYVTLILQESSNFRMERAESALSFFQQEVQRLGDDLDGQSSRIVNFKNINSGSLPSDLNFSQNRQTFLQERLARLEREIDALTKQRQNMVRLFEETGSLRNIEGENLSPAELQLQNLKFDLEQAQAIYSETNPKTVLLRNRIEQLETSLLSRQPNSNSEEPATFLDITLADLEQRITSLNEDLSTVTGELEKLEDSIAATARNALTLASLERDFDNIQTRYNIAVRNLDQARVNERIEVTAQGQRVSVIENANVPQEPSGPGRLKIIAMGVLSGGGLAIGFFVLLELLNRNIRRPFELQSRFGIVPLAIVPYMESPRERTLRRAAMVAAVLAVMIAVPAALFYVDTQYMPLDILASKVFDRLGIT